MPKRTDALPIIDTKRKESRFFNQCEILAERYVSSKILPWTLQVHLFVGLEIEWGLNSTCTHMYSVSRNLCVLITPRLTCLHLGTWQVWFD